MKRTKEEIIQTAIPYTRDFQDRLSQVAAQAPPGGPMGSNLVLGSMYSPGEIAQAAWAGNELGMLVEQAVVQFIMLTAIAYGDSQPKRSLFWKLLKKQGQGERNHVAMFNCAVNTLLDGGEPDPISAPQFARRYAELLERAVSRADQ